MKIEVTTVLQPPPLTKEEVQRISPGVLARVVLERRILWNLIHHLAAAGFKPVWTDNGDGPKVTIPPELMFEEAAAVDECRIGFRKTGTTKTRGVLLVFGNDGIDLISDWSYGEGDPDGFNKAMEAFNPEKYL